MSGSVPAVVPARRAVVPVRARPAVVLAVVSIAGLAAFCWPLFVSASADMDTSSGASFVFLAILPVLVAIAAAELTSGGLDAKTVAILGVLAAVGAALRPLGAGTAGLEPVFFLLVLAGRAFGAGFGFLLGSTTLFASALLTAGVGPWLPYQMLAAAWVGMGAGLLPWRRLRGRWEIVLLCAYGAVAAQLYGFLMNLSGWPYGIAAAGTDVSYVPGAGPAENLHRFVLYCLTTSVWGFDTGRMITNVALIAITGAAVLGALRRAARKAQFIAPQPAHQLACWGREACGASPPGSLRCPTRRRRLAR